MKKCVLLAITLVLLTGCAGEETFETLADVQVQQALAPVREILAELPEEAAAPAAKGENGTLYQCDGYEILLEILPAGDLDATIRAVSGYSREMVTLVQTQQDDLKRYEFVWASAGENGDRLGRAAVLDDGSHHYVLCILADADRAEDCAEVWQVLFDSFALT